MISVKSEMRRGILIFLIVIISIEAAILLFLTKWPHDSVTGFLKDKAISPEEFRALELKTQTEILEKMSAAWSFSALRDFVKKAYPDEPPDKHELAHKLGEFALKEFGLNAFGACDEFLNYGCFHGVALAAIRIYGLRTHLTDALWEGCKKNSPEPGRCLHGLGHAVMIIKGYKLIEAYQECERLLPTENERFWCQDGVTMENIIRSVADPNMEPYGSTTDSHYPCNVIPKRYEPVCARNQLEFAKNRFHFNFNDMIRFCLSFQEERSHQECIGMLGSLQIKKFFTQPERIIEQCRETRRYKRFCIEGAVVAFVSAKHYDRAGVLCKSLSAKEEQNACEGIIKSFIK